MVQTSRNDYEMCNFEAQVIKSRLSGDGNLQVKRHIIKYYFNCHFKPGVSPL